MRCINSANKTKTWLLPLNLHMSSVTSDSCNSSIMKSMTHRVNQDRAGCTGQETTSVLVRSETSFGQCTTWLYASQCGTAQLHCPGLLIFLRHTGPRSNGEMSILCLSLVFTVYCSFSSRVHLLCVQLELGGLILEGVASLIFDCLDWRRQHQHYLDNLKLISVPAVVELDSQPLEVLCTHTHTQTLLHFHSTYILTLWL